MRKIKLLVDGHVFDNEYQGTRTFLKGLYRSFSKLGSAIDLFIASSKPEDLENEFTGIDNINFIKYNSSNKFWRLSVDLPNIINKLKINYLHIQYIAPLIKNCNWIVTIHDLLFNTFPEEFPLTYRLKNNILFRRSAKMSDILTTVSSYSAKQIHKLYEINLDKIYVIPNGVSDEFFADYDRLESKKYIRKKYDIDKFILYVSRIEPRKNHYTLLHVYSDLELAHKGIHLVFIGKQSIKCPKLDLLTRSLDKETLSHVKYYDNISDIDLLAFYRSAELFVYPSKAEGFGIPPLEAIAVGTPTLCSNATAMVDYKFLGKGLFSPDNLDELKVKLLDNLNNPYQFIDSRLEAIKFVKENYRWDVSSKKLATLILAHAHKYI